MTEILLTHGSYLGIIVVLILTGAGLPVPEEVPIIAAGLLSAHGQLNPWLAAASCLFGALAGDCVMYYLGYHFGRGVLREHPRWARVVTPQREAQIEQMLRLHGLKVFFLARFLVGLRSPVYLSAGILRVPFRRFILIDLFCATMVIGTFFGLSYRYGATITQWIREAQYAATGLVLLCLAGVGVYFWRRHRRRHQAETALQVESADPPSASDATGEDDNHSSEWVEMPECPDECAVVPKRGE